MRVFVYGSLLSGLGNHRWLERGGAVLFAPAVLDETGWRLVSLGAFPAMVRTSYAEQQAVVGEVYEVDGPTLAALDRLEGVPHNYDRIEVQVRLGLSRAPVWTYAMLDCDWINCPDVVPGGDWRAYWTARAAAWERRTA